MDLLRTFAGMVASSTRNDLQRGLHKKNKKLKMTQSCNFVPFRMVDIGKYESSNCYKDSSACPLPRSGHRIVYSSKAIYSLGGYNPSVAVTDYQDPLWADSCPLFRELWKFNIVSQQWSRVAIQGDIPVELASHTAVSRNSILIAYGGTSTPFGAASSNDTYICNLKSGKWKKLNTVGWTPRAMYGQAVCRTKNKLYVVGGTSGYTYYLDVYMLDLETLTWSVLIPRYSENTADIRPRYRHEIVEYEGCLFIFGGGTSERSYPLQLLPTFDLKDHYWRYTKTRPDNKSGLFPKPRKCHALVRYKNYVYIHGGTNSKENFSDLWRLNLVSMTWEKLTASTEKAVYFHSAAVTEEGCIYLFGGIWNEESTRTNKTFKIYVDVPSLLTVAWEAILQCNPNIVNLDKNILLKLGIPPTVVQMLS